MSVLTITGFELECECNICGKSLKHGIITSQAGTIGADCFIKAIKVNKQRYSGNGKPSAQMVKQYSVVRAKGFDYALKAHGLRQSAFDFLVLEK